jgi:hypothetical protein
MSLVNFTNLDFDQIKTSIRDYLRSNSNFSDYDFEGSNLSTIIDILAYNTYITSYNANMISNEVFIDSATLRENVVSLAKNIGYLPKSTTSARARISFFVNTINASTQSNALTLKKGVICTSPSSTSSGSISSYTFCTLDDITVPVIDNIALFEDIEIYEGTFISTNFLVDPLNKNQKFILDNANIDTSTIKVSVKDTQQSSVKRNFAFTDDLGSAKSTSRVYFLQEIEDERYEILFGDGIFGRKLEAGNYIEVSYLISNGSSANRISNFSFLGRILDDSNRIIQGDFSLITTNQISDGGQEKESISSIKKYAPRVYSAQNRAVTNLDYESIIRKIYPETDSVTAYGGEELDPPQYGKVFIAIKPKYGETFLSNTVKNNILNDLKKYSVAGILPQIIDLKYLYIETDSDVYYDKNLTLNVNDLSTTIKQNISNYSKSNELNQYGARFKYSKYQKIIDDSNEAITSNITRISIRRDLLISINQPATYEICFGNSFFVRDCDGFNIRSSGFKINDLSDTVYFTDIPNQSDKSIGELVLFKLTASSEPKILRRNVGTVNYDKGEINTFILNVVSTDATSGGNPIIELSATPKSNDVVGLQDLYLQLDINRVSVNMVSDAISSGESTSGSSYTFSSSYKENNIVRK